MYCINTWVEQNRSKAKLYYEKSCKLDNKKGCKNLKTLMNENEALKQIKGELERLTKERDLLEKEAELLDKI